MQNADTVTDKNYPYINPVMVGFEDCESGHSFGPAVRTYWLIHYVVSGKGTFEINNKTYHLEKDDLFVIPPYVETYYIADLDEPWEYVWVGFTCEGELPLRLDDIIHSPAAGRIFTDMKSSFGKKNGKTEFLCAKIWEMFSVLMEKFDENNDPIKKAIDYIHTEYVNGISVSEIAHKINLDRSYFSTLFKSEVGISPHEYLTNYRMTEAEKLMLDRGKSISVTALSVGYPDVYTFSKAFKRRFGLSPRMYLEKTKKHSD